MIEKSRAICLRVAPFGNTSHVVTWLTEDSGSRATIVKGACRPRSAFLGQYDLYYTCELLFYRRERSGTHIARECFPLKTRDFLRENWRSAAVASYLCDATLRELGHGGEGESRFVILEKSLDALCDGMAPLAVMLWSELRQLCMGGWTPRLDGCGACLRGGRENARRFSFSEGRMVCEHFPLRHAADDTVAMSDRLRARIAEWMNSANVPESGREGIVSTGEWLGMQRFLGMFLAFHREDPPEVRSRTLELLAWPTSRSPAGPQA